MSGRAAVALRVVYACTILAWAGSSRSAVAPPESLDGDSALEVWVSVTAPSELRNHVIRGVARELARTPQRHVMRFLDETDSLEDHDATRAFALLEVDFYPDGNGSGPIVDFGRSEGRVSPGWLVHAVLRAAEAVRAPAEVAGPRSSWIAQLVARSTRRLSSGPADEALARGIPAVILHLPPVVEAEGEVELSDASRVLAAVARRLDGLDGPPVFEDEYLVVVGRVWLRRDLYWLCLALWLVLYGRGRSRRSKGPLSSVAGRGFRWLFLVAALVAPVFATVLLGLPAAVAAWRPQARWPIFVSLLPAAYFGIRWSLALVEGAHPTIHALSAALVAAALAGFAWTSRRAASPAPVSG